VTCVAEREREREREKRGWQERYSATRTHNEHAPERLFCSLFFFVSFVPAFYECLISHCLSGASAPLSVSHEAPTLAPTSFSCGNTSSKLSAARSQSRTPGRPLAAAPQMRRGAPSGWTLRRRGSALPSAHSRLTWGSAERQYKRRNSTIVESTESLLKQVCAETKVSSQRIRQLR
jgi:hypothetical protein